MSNRKNISANEYSFTEKRSFDVDSILRDVLRQWWVIILAALAAALCTYGVERMTYKPQYQTYSTVIVGKNGVSANSVSDNLSAASILTSSFSTIVNSDIMNNRICDALQVDSFDGEISVSNVDSTNLVTLYVTANNPRIAYLAIQTAMNTVVDLGSQLSDHISIQVLESPIIPTGVINPFSPKRHIQYAAIGMAAFMCLLFMLISYRKDSVKNEQEMKEKIDGTLLGTVYHERKFRSLIGLLKKAQYSLSIENPTCTFRYIEGLRLIATRIRHEMDKDGKQIILVTSSLENEGKSTFAANLALSISHEGFPTLLMDCDFRKPSQYKIFGLDENKLKEKDLSESILQKQSLMVRKAGFEKQLSCLFTTKASTRMVYGENKDYIRLVLKTLRKQYSYIIIDTSPIGLVAEVEALAQLCDCSVMVIQQDMTEAGFINDMIDRLNETNAPLLGCIFNNVREGILNRMKEMNTGYGYYHSGGYKSYGNYGSYGRYGKYGKYGKYTKSGYGRYGNYGKYKTNADAEDGPKFEYTQQTDDALYETLISDTQKQEGDV